MLPVELLSFSEPRRKHVVLNWTTATEINNQYFTVERSADGIDFEPIRMLDGAGFYYDSSIQDNWRQTFTRNFILPSETNWFWREVFFYSQSSGWFQWSRRYFLFTTQSCRKTKCHWCTALRKIIYMNYRFSVVREWNYIRNKFVPGQEWTNLKSTFPHSQRSVYRRPQWRFQPPGCTIGAISNFWNEFLETGYSQAGMYFFKAKSDIEFNFAWIQNPLIQLNQMFPWVDRPLFNWVSSNSIKKSSFHIKIFKRNWMIQSLTSWTSSPKRILESITKS